MREIIVAHATKHCVYCHKLINDNEPKFPVRYQYKFNGEIKLCGYCCLNCNKPGTILEHKVWKINRPKPKRRRK